MLASFLYGSPRVGIIADIRNKTRSKYHYAVRYIKNNSEACKAQKLVDAMVNNYNNEFWRIVQKMKKNSSSRPAKVDGATNPNDIANLFAEKYEALYMPVSYSEKEMDRLKKDISSLIQTNCCSDNCTSHHSISIDMVCNAINHLKLGKHDGDIGCYSDHLVHGTDKLNYLLSLLFNAMLKHGFAPDGFLNISIHPIPKNKRKSLYESENYRGIALSSILGKVLDWIILQDNFDILNSRDLQFGFKAGCSTTQCSFVLSECIQYYKSHGSSVQMVFLDATKAFDRVEYVKLFSLLLKKGICPCVARLLLNMYVNQSITVAWDSETSRPFKCNNGVKQGGVLSPLLFGIYIDELLARLKALGFGCHIGHLFSGALAYADDLVLLAPTVLSMSKMLKVCDEYAKEYHVMFNPKKSEHIVHGGNHQNVNLYIDGIPITKVNQWKHSGRFVGPKATYENIQISVHKFNTEVNMIMAQFSKIFPDIRYQLFKTYCMPLYGCQLWDFSQKDVEYFYTAWRKAIRFIWRIPFRSHNNLLSYICEDLPVEAQLHRRFMKFYYKVLSSVNSLVSTCGLLARDGSCSNVCNSLNVISRKYSINKYNLPPTYAQCLKQINSYGDLQDIGIVVTAKLRWKESQESDFQNAPHGMKFFQYIEYYKLNLSQSDQSVTYTYCNYTLLTLTVPKIGKIGKKRQKRDLGLFLNNYWE